MMYDPHQIISGPIVTEKSSGLRGSSVYTLRVLKDATKSQIKNATEKIFGVDVESVNTTKVRGKTRQLGRSVGRTSAWKKAYIKLKEGQKIKELEVNA